MQVKSVMVAAVPVSWYSADGSDSEYTTMSINAMTTRAGAKVGMDTNEGGFYVVPEQARRLAALLTQAADEAERLVREQVS
jgi:hypothetical protein